MNYDRLILTILDRITSLEEEVSLLKNRLSSKTIEEGISAEDKCVIGETNRRSRDKTKYIFNGVVYGKNRLVLAIVKEYANQNPTISAEKMMLTFDNSLQGSLGVVRLLNDVKKSYADYQIRFFCEPNEIIHTSTEDLVVCTQWQSKNILNMISRAKELGMIITCI